MSTDQRLDRYFTARATTIELRPGDPTQIAARATARRRRRRSVATGVTALAVVAAAIGVQQAGGGGGDDRADLAAQPGLTAATPLDWTVVQPTVGLASSDSTAVTADGTLYGLSTAPGRHDPSRPPGPRVLYRSDDGVEWQTVSLPDAFYPAQLAAHGDQLYAVGTAPAGGGGRAVVLGRTSADGAWEQIDLPLDLAALEQAYGRVGVHPLTVAVGDSGAVAAVTVMAYPDAEDLLPAGAELADWSWTADGLEVYEINCDRATLPKAGGAVASDGSRELPYCRSTAMNRREPVARYTWDELGIDERLRSLIQGEVHVFTSVDGNAFTEVDLPAGARTGATVVATDSGYVLITSHWEQPHVEVFRSSDGQTWTAEAAASFGGYVVSAGTLGGRAAVVTNGDAGSVVLHVMQDDGSWSSTDLTAAIDVPAGKDVRGGQAHFGPLGLAALVTVSDPDGSSAAHHVVFVDERGVSSVAIPDVADSGVYPMSVRVSADAVTVALLDPPTDPNGESIRTMRLLVGTPAG